MCLRRLLAAINVASGGSGTLLVRQGRYRHSLAVPRARRCQFCGALVYGAKKRCYNLVGKGVSLWDAVALPIARGFAFVGRAAAAGYVAAEPYI